MIFHPSSSVPKYWNWNSRIIILNAQIRTFLPQNPRCILKIFLLAQLLICLSCFWVCNSTCMWNNWEGRGCNWTRIVASRLLPYSIEGGKKEIKRKTKRVSWDWERKLSDCFPSFTRLCLFPLMVQMGVEDDESSEDKIMANGGGSYEPTTRGRERLWRWGEGWRSVCDSLLLPRVTSCSAKITTIYRINRIWVSTTTPY